MDPIERTIELAMENVEAGGKPFACVILRGGETLAESPNLVVQTHDPTAHAEIVAIREACMKLGTSSLEGCEIYVLAHPCPMCLGALYYASPDSVVFVTEREQYARYYKDDGRYFELETFYDEYPKAWQNRRLPMRHEPDEAGLAVYERWRQLNS